MGHCVKLAWRLMSHVPPHHALVKVGANRSTQAKANQGRGGQRKCDAAYGHSLFAPGRLLPRISVIRVGQRLCMQLVQFRPCQDLGHVRICRPATFLCKLMVEFAVQNGSREYSRFQTACSKIVTHTHTSCVSQRKAPHACTFPNLTLAGT